MRKYLALSVAAMLLLAAVAYAQAASITLSLTITSPPSTGITFTPAPPFTGSGTSFSAVGPIASGVTVGTFVVAPTGWQGAFALSGTNASSFTLSGMSLVTAATLDVGTTYAITATATP